MIEMTGERVSGKSVLTARHDVCVCMCVCVCAMLFLMPKLLPFHFLIAVSRLLSSVINNS